MESEQHHCEAYPSTIHHQIDPIFRHGVLLTLLHNLTVGYSYIRFHLKVTANEVKLYKAGISCFKIANLTTVFLLFPSLDCHYILNRGSKDLVIAYERWRFETKPPGRMFSSLTEKF